MDRIEPVDGSSDPPGTSTPFPSLPAPSSDAAAQRPSSYHQNQHLSLSQSQTQSQSQAQHPPQRPQPLSRARRPSIRISRPPSIPSLDNVPTLSSHGYDENISRQQTVQPPPPPTPGDDGQTEGNRRRSSSEPRLGRWPAPNLAMPGQPGGGPAAREQHMSYMRPLREEPLSPIASEHRPTLDLSRSPEASELPEIQELPPPQPTRNGSLLRRTSNAALHRLSRNRASTVTGTSARPPLATRPNLTEYDPRIVDVLDVIDPEVAALSTLTNVQNSLFIPNLGGFLNRMPTYTLTPARQPPGEEGETTTTDEEQEPEPEPSDLERPQKDLHRLHQLSSISSVLKQLDHPRFAVLPDGTTLEGWTTEDVGELNDHVRHMLHSRRSKFKRSMRGFGQYVKKPLGFFVTLYATLITLFGLAWVLFLIGWINVGGRQLYIINVIDNVLVALFAIMGDGLAPFRAIDTYHMIFIAHYTFLTWKIRNKRELPNLKDKNDLPARREMDVDVEFGDTPPDEKFEYSVLKRRQQLRLMHHQDRMSKSHTFYKPHETMTHFAFPSRILIAIVVLLDCHSLFQIALGACTWGISYHVRPFALTTVILCCSIACNITGGILIMIGDRRSRKKDVVERMFRQQLTEEAMKKIEKRKRKEERRQREEAARVEGEGDASGSGSGSGTPLAPISPEKTVEPYKGT